jgi:hypothetical protein
VKSSALALLLLALLAQPALAQEDPKGIAARYAPVIYQEFSIYTQDPEDPDRAYDQLRRVDYDGDWDPLNNLNNHGRAGNDNRGYVYYDVKSTKTHHYVTYTFYYVARTTLFMRRNENDLMGCVVVVRRDAPKGQEVESVMIRQRDRMKAVLQDEETSPARRKYEGSDGRKRKVAKTFESVQFDHPEIDPERTHPRIFMDTWNHSPRVLDPERQKRDQLRFPYLSGRGLVYHHHDSVAHEAPSRGETVVRYELLPQSDLDRVETKSEDGTRLGSDDSVWGLKGPLLPHAWPVAKGLAPGAMATDPAGTYAELFKVRQPFSTDYVSGKPAGHTDGAVGSLGQVGR